MKTPAAFTQEELDIYYSRLDERKGHLLKTLKDHQEMALKQLTPEYSSERGPTGYHQADQASDTAEQEKYSILVALEIKEVQEIEDALIKIASGDFGSCEICHQQIELLRLETIPQARFCGSCEESEEKMSRIKKRTPLSTRLDYNVK